MSAALWQASAVPQAPPPKVVVRSQPREIGANLGQIRHALRGLERKVVEDGVTDYSQRADDNTTVIFQVATDFDGPATSSLATRIETSLPIAFDFPAAFQKLADQIRDLFISRLEERGTSAPSGGHRSPAADRDQIQ
jgi:hypothetical protein